MPQGEVADLTVSKLGRWSAERLFAAELSQVRVARAWLREVFAESCGVLDDCVLVVSELLANAAEHGGGGQAAVTVSHGLGGALGALVHEAVPLGVPTLVPDVVAEMARLLSLCGSEPVAVERLAESGRGLAVVATLCDGAVEVRQTTAATVIRWALDGCGCEVVS